MTSTLPTPTLPTTSNITDSTVCISLSFGSLGNSRKVSTEQIEADTDKSLLRVSKQLLDSKELKAIGSLDGETRSELLKIALPSLFRTGIYLLPIKAIEKTEEFLHAQSEKRAELIKTFLGVYATRKAEAQERLKGLYDPTDYPSVKRVAAQFTFEWQYVTFQTPTKLADISAGFFAQEQQKASAKWAEATEEVTLLLRSQLRDLVGHLVDRLTPGDDGKPKRFHTSNVTNLAEFLENFNIRNVVNDGEMDALVSKCKQLLEGVDVKDLRENDGLRDGLQSAFNQVKSHLDTMVVTAGSRRIQLGDEE